MENTSPAKVLFNVDTRGVATVTLNNPDKHNAFDDQVIAELNDLFVQIASRSDIRVMVLASTGKSFSAGADLGWMKRMAQYDYEQNLKDANALAQMLYHLNALPQPTIAKVQGAAFGGAVGLAACCDMVVASDQANFCLSEVKLGLIPATISPYVIAAMGERACRRYFVTAERFSAKAAQQLGLVSEVVAIDALAHQTEQLIASILNNGPMAVGAAKQLIVDVAGQPVNNDIMADTSARIAAIRVSEEGQEGLGSFFERRAPNWQTTNNSDD